MLSPQKKQPIKSGSNVIIPRKELDSQERFYSPQNDYDIDTQPIAYFNSEKKKTTNSRSENEENDDNSNQTFLFISEQDEEEEDSFIKKAQMNEKKRSQFSDNLHRRVSRHPTYEMTEKNQQKEVEEKQKQQIDCECDFNRFDLIKKKSWKSIEVEEDAKILKCGKWTKTRCMLTKNQLAFIQIFFKFTDISKVKIFELNKDAYQQIVKIQVDQNSHFFSLDARKKVHDLPLPFYVFARIIIKKIEEMKIGEIQAWNKTSHIEKSVTMDSYIFGKIYKRSQHLGIWSQRYIVIKKQGIYSYKDETKQENYSFFIAKSSIKYIWTRLQLTSKFLIVKIKHGIAKTEFGIPINNYSCRGCKNWLYDLYRMLI